MFSTGKKNLNSSELHSGQTLFDFLKRKKKVALETSLKKSQFTQINKESIDIPSLEKDTKRNQLPLTSYKKENIGVNLTPKRVSFVDQEQKRQPHSRSFVQMISPIKRKVSAIEREKQPMVEDAPGRSLSKNKKSIQDVYTRKNLNSSMNALKGTLHKFIESGKSLKQKSHTLFIELKPILKIVEEGENKNFARRAEDVRIKLRTFEHLFKEFNIENGNEIIENFHRNLSEHINSTQAHLRADFEKDQIDSLKKIRDNKDTQISRLTHEKKVLEKQISILEKRLEKSQRLNMKLKEESQAQFQGHSKTLEEKVKQYEEKVSTLSQDIQFLTTELDESRQDKKKFQKMYKDAVYNKDEFQKKMIEEQTKIKASKQEYLLNQIMILKKEFHADMTQLTNLYTTKEKDHLILIQQLRKEIGQLQTQRIYDKEIEGRVTDDANAFKVQVAKYKKQNECLVTDMHRMNEELYQHWLALKDIKTLASRLQILHKFSKIYEDLNYNDRLFD